MDNEVVFRHDARLCAESIAIRTEVFIKEQGFRDEFDALDERSRHLVAFVDRVPVGTTRYYRIDQNTFAIGRLAIVKSHRGQGLAKALIRQTERAIEKEGGSQIQLHAQKRLQAMYEKFGFSSLGVEDEDEGVPHIWMAKSI